MRRSRFLFQIAKTFCFQSKTHWLKPSLVYSYPSNAAIFSSHFSSESNKLLLNDDFNLIALANRINSAITNDFQSNEFMERFDLSKEVIENFRNVEDEAKRLEALNNLRSRINGKTFGILEEVFSGTSGGEEFSFHKKCSGCGAVLQTQSRLKPGFISNEQLNDTCTYKKVTRDIRCKRCIALQTYDIALATSIKPEQFKKIVSHRLKKNRSSAVLVMVDLTDVTDNTVAQLLKGILHKRIEVLLIGNKFDLLPPDSFEYDKNIEEFLKRSADFLSYQLKGVHLISAKTGYGVETLITDIQELWLSRRDIYLIGAVNVGKSSLFNLLLDSDLGKGKFMERYQRATVSKWPGTTLDTLKFPIEAISSKDWLAARKASIKKRAEKVSEKRCDGESYVSGVVDRAMSTGLAQLYADRSADLFDFHNGNSASELRLKDEKWFHDTPGISNDDSVLPFLNEQELRLVIPNEAYKPRIFSLAPNQALTFGGLGKVEYKQGMHDIFLFVFSCPAIPIVIATNDETNLHFQTWLSSGKLQVPSSSERFDQLGSFRSINLNFTAERPFHAVTDILFGSTGWLTVVLRKPDTTADLSAHCLRSAPTLRAPLLEKVHRLMGKRQRGTPKIETRKDYEKLFKYGKAVYKPSKERFRDDRSFADLINK